MDQRITLITLGVDDTDRAAGFYERLGWQQAAASTPGLRLFQLDGQALALFSRKALAADQGRPGIGLGTGAMTLAQNFATRETVDTAWQGAVQAGGTPLKRPEATEWGGYSGYFADPDGHVWELAHNPFWPLDAAGALTLPG